MLRACYEADCPTFLPRRAGVEYASEAVADALGLNDSQYQWVIDQYMKEKELVHSFPTSPMKRLRLVGALIAHNSDCLLAGMVES